jgi:hypothetical protein
MMAPTYQVGQDRSTRGLALLPSKPLFLTGGVAEKRPEN